MLNLLLIIFGGVFTLASAYGLGAILLRRVAAPPQILLAVGAAAESLLVFILLLCHAAVWPVFLALGACAVAALKWRGPAAPAQPEVPLLSSGERAVFTVIYAAYGIFYLVNALAPEIQADGITYHLGLPYEYVRLGAFPSHVRFYDLIPQGMEMLFTMAFSFGRHAAAKLLELGLFAAAVPLIFRIGRRLGMSDTSSLVVAAFYGTAPVMGLTGSSSYNDTALVFFTLAAFYLLLVWRETGEARYLLPAGALAGFCYAIKFPGLFAAAGAVLFVAAASRRRRSRDVALLLAGVALTAAPWLIRSTILTGNPVAPLANDLFRNPYFHLRTGSELASNMRSLHGIPPSQVPWELAFGDRLTGTFGPLLYLLPLGLLSLGTRTGRICVGAALILAVPWWSNTGARFLMPAAMLAAFALAMVLPRKVAWAVIALQALVCWPPLLNTWQPPYTFRLHEIPWKAAFGMETKEHYLQNHVPEYNVARMVEHYTAPDAGIFSLIPVATAYVARDISVSWQSAGGECLTDALNVAAKIQEQPLYDWTATWPPASLRGVRFRMPVELSREWDLAEVQLFSGDDRLYNSPSWSLRAWPNVWEATLAFDNRRSTVWRTWEPTRRGMFLEVDFDHAQLLSAAVLTSHNGPFEGPLEFHGQGPDGKWRLLSNRPSASQRPPEDLRLEATGVIRRAGYQYLLVPLGPSGNGPLGKQIQEHAPQWGLVAVGNAGPNVLFKLR